jgi:hypothetical protein
MATTGPSGSTPPLEPASGRRLLRASAIAVGLAGLLLLVAVLPAEYGIDVTGAGRALGLDRLYDAGTSVVSAPVVVPSAGGPIAPQPGAYRVDARQFRLESLESLEFKYRLARGATVTYSWTATAPVDFDFHSEDDARRGASQTFERGEAAEKHGTYTAPFDGIHGWYWENLTDRPVTITLRTAGFYAEAVLYRDGASPERTPIPEESR